MYYSTSQALGVWTELMQAYFGCNSYGGDVAEIYLYRLQPKDPGKWDEERDDRRAVRSLFDILREFEGRLPCSVEVEEAEERLERGGEGPLNRNVLDAMMEPLSHRYHVRVSPDNGGLRTKGALDGGGSVCLINARSVSGESKGLLEGGDKAWEVRVREFIPSDEDQEP